MRGWKWKRFEMLGASGSLYILRVVVGGLCPAPHGSESQRACPIEGMFSWIFLDFVGSRSVFYINITFFDGKAIKIVFHDTGCGIDPKLFDKIFTPFFTTKEVGKGTGLGLSISSGIITDHNGSISVESTLGKGTSFTISLPLNDIEEAVEHVPTDGEDYYEI